MIEFAVSVQGQKVTCTKEKGELVSGAKGVKVRFTWSEEWQQLQKIGVFRTGSIARDVMDLQEECVIPWEVLTEPGQVLMIGIQGINEDGTAVTPTLMAEMDEIKQGADPSDDPTTDPTLPIWQWVKNLLEQVIQKFTNYFQRIETLEDKVNVNEDEIAELQELKPVKTVNGLEPDANGNVAIAADNIFPNGDTLTWDGNTEGRAVVEYVGWGALHRQVHVSDVVLTRDDFSDEGCYQTEVNAAGKSHTLHFKKEQCYANGEYLTIGNIISVFPEGVGVEHEGDDDTKYHYPKPGIYFYKEDWEVRSLTIPGFTGFVDPALLPGYVATKEYVDEAVGDIESALDSIIAIQNSLMGGEGV